ncbi:MAG TPA: NAD-dependent epimerase/dehydratase family protein [Bryobacteraceae bacterium]|nr:NAD-dependent epimerase/dehydratase family protein [Bryobacteraceae bacterium]
MDRIALFGAAGAIGGSIAAELRKKNQPYRVAGRGRTGLERAFGSDPNAEIVTWNPDDPASVRAAASGVGTIFYLVGVPYWQFELHPRLMRKTLEGAIAEGVERIVLIGTVYPFGRPRTERVREDHPREPHTFKGRMRKEQEDLVLDSDSSGKIHGTILRLPDFYGPGVDKSFLASAFQAAVNGGRAQLVGPIDKPHEFVFVPDVGPVALALASEPRAYGSAWNFAGPGAIAQRAFVEQVFREADRKPKYIVANKTMLRIMGMFSPMMREMVEMNYLFETPVIMDDSAIRALLGDIRKTSYEEGIRETLRLMRAVQHH